VAPTPLEHCPTGIAGLDDITSGGLPRGRTTLVAGGPGCGKTLLGVEFLVRGAEMGEAGVFLAFEETAEELTANVASLGWDLDELCGAGKLVVDHVKVERERIDETGDYDLEALFIRIGYGIQEIGAKRVVLDTIEVLFSALEDTAKLRAELRRLFSWLKGQGPADDPRGGPARRGAGAGVCLRDAARPGRCGGNTVAGPAGAIGRHRAALPAGASATRQIHL
jgi:circadian clock protein KaiC